MCPCTFVKLNFTINLVNIVGICALRTYQPNLKDSKSIVPTMLPLSSGNQKCTSRVRFLVGDRKIISMFSNH